MERELKLVLDAAGYLRLASTLPAYEDELCLANHYFDTSDRALRRRGALLRVRESEEGCLAGLKQAVSVQGGTFQAVERELPLTEWDWARVLRAGDLGILEHPVIRDGFELARSAVLPYQGTLRVQRKIFRLSPATALELDLSCFEDGSQDWELEVETERPEGVRPFVEELLERRGIPTQEQTRTKYERFLERRGLSAPPPLPASREGEVQTIGEGVLVHRSPLAGGRVVATRRFAPGEPILELEGAPAAAGPRPPGRRWIQVGPRRFLDATGTVAAQVRHSCEPTAGVRGARVLAAREVVEPGDEVTYDYAMTEPALDLICVCGSAACRGVIGGYRRLGERLRTLYRGWVSEYLLEDEADESDGGSFGPAGASGAAWRPGAETLAGWSWTLGEGPSRPSSLPAGRLGRGYRYGARPEAESGTEAARPAEPRSIPAGEPATGLSAPDDPDSVAKGDAPGGFPAVWR